MQICWRQRYSLTCLLFRFVAFLICHTLKREKLLKGKKSRVHRHLWHELSNINMLLTRQMVFDLFLLILLIISGQSSTISNRSTIVLQTPDLSSSPTEFPHVSQSFRFRWMLWEFVFQRNLFMWNTFLKILTNNSLLVRQNMLFEEIIWTFFSWIWTTDSNAWKSHRTIDSSSLQYHRLSNDLVLNRKKNFPSFVNFFFFEVWRFQSMWRDPIDVDLRMDIIHIPCTFSFTWL